MCVAYGVSSYSSILRDVKPFIFFFFFTVSLAIYSRTYLRTFVIGLEYGFSFNASRTLVSS